MSLTYAGKETAGKNQSLKLMTLLNVPFVVIEYYIKKELLIQNSQFSIKPFESGLVIVMGKTKCNK
jgi:hypothetical protein